MAAIMTCVYVESTRRTVIAVTRARREATIIANETSQIAFRWKLSDFQECQMFCVDLDSDAV